MDQFLNESTIALVTEYAVRAIGVLLLLAVAAIVARWVSGRVLRLLQAANFDTTLRRFLSTLTRYSILLIAGLMSLSVFGVETTTFAALLGATGFAIGLAFQNSLSNFSAGVMMLVIRPFEVGDSIRAAGESGKVELIALFTTRIDTWDNRRITIPNSQLFNGAIENLSFHDVRRIDVSVGTAYEADIDETRRVLEKTAKAEPLQIEDRDADVVLGGLGNSAIDWRVSVWVNSSDFGTVKQSLTRNIKVALDSAAIGIPYPQMDVHVANVAG
jgi:small conductance mechanosensitive channel